MTVHPTYVVIGPFAKFYGRHILEPQHSTVALGADDHILVIDYVLITSTVFEHISECVFRLGSESSCRSFKVLLGQDGRDVRRHQSVFCHLARIEPDSERIITTSHIYLTDSCNTRKTWFDIDLKVVDDEFPVKRIVRTIECYGLDTACLSLFYGHTALGNLARKKALC